MEIHEYVFYTYSLAFKNNRIILYIRNKLYVVEVLRSSKMNNLNIGPSSELFVEKTVFYLILNALCEF
jgi:hypothetical protein